MNNDTLAHAMSAIMNYEKIGRKEIVVHPTSKVMKKVFELLQNSRYLGAAETVTAAKGGYIKVNLLGAINKCGVIKPRFAVSWDEIEKFEKRYLPAKDIGIIIVSTEEGMMTHKEAKEKGKGGRLIAYCY